MAAEVWLAFILFLLGYLIVGWFLEDIRLVLMIVVYWRISLLLGLRASFLLAFAVFGWIIQPWTVVFTFWMEQNIGPSPLAAELGLVRLCVLAWISTMIIPYWVARLRDSRNELQRNPRITQGQLCHRCSVIRMTETGMVHHDLSNLRDYASQGCPLCKLLLEALGKVSQRQFSDKGRSKEIGDPSYSWRKWIWGELMFSYERKRGRVATIELGHNRTDLSYTMHNCVETDRNGTLIGRGSHLVQDSTERDFTKARSFRTIGYNKITLYLEFFHYRSSQEAVESKITFRELRPALDDELTYALLDTWIKNCVDGQDKCARYGVVLPSRVLDVSKTQINLTKGDGLEDDYIALSHCRGNNATFKTTKATFQQRRRGIDFKVLPQTFKDAVTITRRLGISYLWIDSLCIIQDKKTDWLKESTRMKDYYRNSFLTISALSSTDSHHGILRPRIASQEVQLTSSSNLYIRPRTPNLREVFTEAPLNQRAWALQERLLSTRVLHNGSSELFWECLTCSTRESNCKEHTDEVDPDEVNFSEGEDFKRVIDQIARGRGDVIERALTTWYRLASQYSRRALTFETDRLLAISALASEIGRRSGLTYVSGLWKEDIFGFLWYLEHPNKLVVDDASKVHLCTVPTWSWAAITGSVRFREGWRESGEQMAKILETRPSSLLLDAFIRIQAFSVKFSLAKMRHMEIGKRGKKDGKVRPTWKTMYPWRLYMDSASTAAEDKPREICIAVLIARLPMHTPEIHIEPHILSCFLLLARSGKSKKNQWKRIGLAETTQEVQLEDPKLFKVI